MSEYTFEKDPSGEKKCGAHIYNILFAGRVVGWAERAAGDGYTTLSGWEVNWEEMDDSPCGTIGFEWTIGSLVDLKKRLPHWTAQRNKREN